MVGGAAPRLGKPGSCRRLLALAVVILSATCGDAQQIEIPDIPSNITWVRKRDLEEKVSPVCTELYPQVVENCLKLAEEFNLAYLPTCCDAAVAFFNEGCTCEESCTSDCSDSLEVLAPLCSPGRDLKQVDCGVPASPPPPSPASPPPPRDGQAVASPPPPAPHDHDAHDGDHEPAAGPTWAPVPGQMSSQECYDGLLGVASPEHPCSLLVNGDLLQLRPCCEDVDKLLNLGCGCSGHCGSDGLNISDPLSSCWDSVYFLYGPAGCGAMDVNFHIPDCAPAHLFAGILKEQNQEELAPLPEDCTADFNSMNDTCVAAAQGDDSKLLPCCEAAKTISDSGCVCSEGCKQRSRCKNLVDNLIIVDACPVLGVPLKQVDCDVATGMQAPPPPPPKPMSMCFGVAFGRGATRAYISAAALLASEHANTQRCFLDFYGTTTAPPMDMDHSGMDMTPAMTPGMDMAPGMTPAPDDHDHEQHGIDTSSCQSRLKMPDESYIQMRTAVQNLEDERLVGEVQGAIDCVEGGSDFLVFGIGSSGRAPALIAEAYDGILMSGGYTSSELSNRRSFPAFARTIPSAAVFARATADFVLHMKWRKILIFYAEDEEPTLLGQHCQDAGVIVTRQLFNPGSQDSMTRALKAAISGGDKVFLSFASGEDALFLAFTAESLGASGRKGYVWIHSRNLYPLDSIPNDSTGNEITTAYSRALLSVFGNHLFIEMAVSRGKAAQKLREEMASLDRDWLQAELDGLEAAQRGAAASLVDSVLQGPLERSAGYWYDAVWAIYLALAEVHMMQHSMVGHAHTTDQVMDVITRLEFEGASGTVRFDDNGDRHVETARVAVMSIAADPDSINTGRLYTYTESGVWEARFDLDVPGASSQIGKGEYIGSTWEISSIQWPDGTSYPSIPSDGFVDIEAPVQDNGGLSNVAVFVVVGSLGLLFLAVCVGVLFFRTRLARVYQEHLARVLKTRGPPGGGSEVTIVITDIQGSTSLWDRYPNAMSRGLELHNGCMRKALNKFCGYELTTEGDSFQIAFHDPSDALAWCCYVQQQLITLDWPPELEDGGDSILHGGDEWSKPHFQTHLLYSHLKDAISRAAASLINRSRAIKRKSEEITTTSLVSRQAGHFDLVRRHSSSGGEDDSSLVADREEMVLALSREVTEKSADAVGGRNDSYTTGTLQVASREGSDGRTPSNGQLGTLAHSNAPDYEAIFRAGNLMGQNQDGQLFRGLRVRMGVHTGIAPERSKQEAGTRRQSNFANLYDGKLMRDAKKVSDTPCGGQIVMSGAVLQSISIEELRQHMSQHDRFSTAEVAGSMIIVHLGQHMLTPEVEAVKRNASFANHGATNDDSVDMENEEGGEGGDGGGETDVIMVVPGALQLRALFYPKINSVRQVSPSFFDAPGKQRITIVFSYLEGAWELREWHAKSFATMMTIYRRLIRKIMGEFGGYEVHEAEGNFLFAFHEPLQAVQWMITAQENFNNAWWPRKILEHPAAMRTLVNDSVLFSGPRVAMGAALGDAVKMRPCLRSGKADYYGPVMNHAARLGQAAHGGQVLVSGDVWEAVPVQVREELQIQHVVHGDHRLKGVKHPVHIVQLSDPVLVNRPFPPIKTHGKVKPMPAGGSQSVRNIMRRPSMFRLGDDAGSNDTVSSGVGDGSDVADHGPPRLDRLGSTGRSSTTSSYDWAKNYLDDANGKSDLAQGVDRPGKSRDPNRLRGKDRTGEKAKEKGKKNPRADIESRSSTSSQSTNQDWSGGDTNGTKDLIKSSGTGRLSTGRGNEDGGGAGAEGGASTGSFSSSQHQASEEADQGEARPVAPARLPMTSMEARVLVAAADGTPSQASSRLLVDMGFNDVSVAPTWELLKGAISAGVSQASSMPKLLVIDSELPGDVSWTLSLLGLLSQLPMGRVPRVLVLAGADGSSAVTRDDVVWYECCGANSVHEGPPTSKTLAVAVAKSFPGQTGTALLRMLMGKKKESDGESQEMLRRLSTVNEKRESFSSDDDAISQSTSRGATGASVRAVHPGMSGLSRTTMGSSGVTPVSTPGATPSLSPQTSLHMASEVQVHPLNDIPPGYSPSPPADEEEGGGGGGGAPWRGSGGKGPPPLVAAPGHSMGEWDYVVPGGMSEASLQGMGEDYVIDSRQSSVTKVASRSASANLSFTRLASEGAPAGGGGEECMLPPLGSARRYFVKDNPPGGK